MDVDENKDGSSEGKPGTSNDNVNNPGTSHENSKEYKKRDRDSHSQSCSSYSSMMEFKIKDQKPPAPHLGTKKMREEKKERRRRNVGRVDKRRKRRRRYRRSYMTNTVRTRAPSVSSDDSRRSYSPRPKCKYCGHRCCMQRNQSRTSRTSRTSRKKKGRAQRAKISKIMLSECNQIGSRCAMLSPLFISCNETPQELTAAQSVYCEITPQMIHHSVQELTMCIESVPSEAILYHLQTNYPVNPNVEEAANELAEKLYVANIIGIVWSLPDDHWRLTTALEKLNKLEHRHVTLFWRMYADTMRPLDINRKSRLTRRDAQSGPS